MVAPGKQTRHPTDPPSDTANDNGGTPGTGTGAVPRIPLWNPEATVRFAEVVRSVAPPRRPSFVSRPALPPDPGALLLDSLALDYESAKRYANPSVGAHDSEIGRGGIGRVCLLVDQHLGREVALKELLTDGSELPSTEGTLRLLAEARITGQLEHPNIVPVYDIGRRQDGRLYYTMRVIRGQTLSDALETARTLAQRLELLPHVARACNAIAYAHSRGVIHRDIKPDNIMIGEFGETVVLDWGIAKLRGVATPDGRARPRGVVELAATSDHGLVGTPLYMSPEQASGAQELDETTDVWSLGVLLYVVLTGRVPFYGDDLASVRAQILRGKPKPLRKLEPGLPPELVAVTERALARERLDRYPDAKHLATDLDAYMSGARVLAHQYSAFDLARRFARRHRAATWVAALALVVLVGVAGSLQRRILQERDRAVSAEKVALEKEHLARVSLAEFYADRAQSSLGRGDLPGALVYSARSLAESETPRARGAIVALTGSEIWQPVRVPEGVLERANRRYARNLDWQRATGVRVTDGSGRTSFELPSAEPLSGAAISFDGRVVALGGRAGSLTLCWPDTGKTLSLRGHRGSVVALAFNRDTNVLATAGLDRSIHLWDVETGAPGNGATSELGQPTALSFDDTGQRLFVATQEHELLEVDTRDWSHPKRISTTAESIEWVGFDEPDLVFAKGREGVIGWSKARPTRGPLFNHPSNVLAIAHLTDTRLAAGGLARDGVCLIDLTRGVCATRLPFQSEQVRVMSASSSGRRLALGTSDGEITIWNAVTLLPERILHGHESSLRGLTFASRDAALLSASLDGTIVKWDSQTGVMIWRQTASHGVQHLAWDEVTDSVWASTRGGVIERRSSSGDLTGSVVVAREWAMAATVSSVHQTLFAINGEGEVVAVDPVALQIRESRAAHDGRALAIVLSPDQQVLATSGEDGLVLLWRSATLEPLARLVHHKGAARALEFSPDGRYLASAGDDRSIRQWDLSRLLTAPSELLTRVLAESASSNASVAPTTAAP